MPFHLPSIGEEEIQEVVSVLRSGWLTTGPKTAQFEQEFGEYVDASHALAVNSCTAGLHLALAALDIGPGDEVITTPLTFCATVNTILHTGATPVFADVGPDGNLDPASVAARITPRTRAILPVHLAGLPCDMGPLWTLARSHGLAVVEDAAHAVGARTAWGPVGSSGPDAEHRSDAVAFSFYATKNLTTGEGGMVTTWNPELYDRMKVLCLHGISRDAWNRYSARGNWYYEVLECGFKYNLSDIQSAIGIHQLRRQEEFLSERERLAAAYDRAFADVEELETPAAHTAGRHAWHLYVLRLAPEKLTIGRDQFIRLLRERGVCTSVHFIPLTLQPAFAELARRAENACPRAEEMYSRSLSLPLFPGLQEKQQRLVTDAVKEIVQHARNSVMVAVGA